MLLLNLPHPLHSAEHVAAPQHDAPTDHRVAALGKASNGSDSRAPILMAEAAPLGWIRVRRFCAGFVRP